MENDTDSDQVSGPGGGEVPSDWQQTVSEHPDSPPKKTKDTTSPGELNSSGMPIPEMLINRPMGSGKIVGYIGSGGMGDVYKIWNEHVNRFHAIKLLKHGSNLQAEKRFEREIKVTATFDHTNIVHVYGAGRWKGYLFLEMEYIEGSALDALLRKHGRFPPVVCSAIGVLVASALHYAHHHSYTLDGEPCTGVVHRDLKPSNIMLSNSGRLKLMDFGIAKPVGGALTSLTMGIVGSWAYLPPEQLDGCAIDHRADIYALGEVLYELCTGRASFVFENQRDFLNSKTRGKYVPVDVAATGVPDAFIRIIEKCLKVNPDVRYQSALEVGNELTKIHSGLSARTPEAVLTSFLAGEKVEECGAAPVQRFPNKVHRIVGGGLLAVLLCIVLLTLQKGCNRHRETVAVAAAQVVELPQLIAPVNDTIASGATPLLVWHAVPPVKKYLVHIASTAEFSDTVLLRTTPDTSSTIDGLQRAHDYFWRTGFVDGSKNTVWSAPGRFTIALPLPGTPELLAPENKRKNIERDVTLRWSAPSPALKYRIQIGVDRGFEHPVFDSSGCHDTVLSVHSFEFSTNYFWRVQAQNGNASGAWSAICEFSVRSAPDSGTTVDYGVEAVAALKDDKLAEAEAAVYKLARSDSRKDTLLIRLAEKFLNAGNMTKAKQHLKAVTVVDKLGELLRGRVLLAEQNCPGAFKTLDASARFGTKFKSIQIGADVCYFTAVAANCCYNSDKSDEARQAALNAWRNVCKLYKGDASHPRYKEAARESNRIAE